MTRWQSTSVWIALIVAFAPVLVDLGRNLAISPAAHSTIISPLLIVFCLVRGRGRRVPRFRSGIALLFLGVVLEIVGIVGYSWSIARLGLPVAIIGVAGWTGTMPLAVASLAFWMIPIPDFVLGFTTPNLESALLSAAATVVGAIGVDVTTVGPVARIAADRLELVASDTGILLAFVLSEFGWLMAALRSARPIQFFATAGCFGLLAVPLQLIAVIIALAVLAAGWPLAAEAWLLHGVWPTVALGAVLYLRARGVLNA